MYKCTCKEREREREGKRKQLHLHCLVGNSLVYKTTLHASHTVKALANKQGVLNYLPILHFTLMSVYSPLLLEGLKSSSTSSLLLRLCVGGVADTRSSAGTLATSEESSASTNVTMGTAESADCIKG